MDSTAPYGMTHPMLRRGFLAAYMAVLLHVLAKSHPKVKLKLFSSTDLATLLRCCLYGTPPIVWLNHRVKPWCNRRIANSPQFDFQTEKVNMVVGMFVQPI